MDSDTSVIVNGWINDYNFMTSKNNCDWNVVACNDGYVSVPFSKISDVRNVLKDWCF